MNYNYQDAKTESQQEYFGTIHTDNTKTLQNALDRIAELEAQIERMKNNCLDLMRVQSFNLTDDYMAGMYNGMAVVYNSCFLDYSEKKGEGYSHKNNFNKWVLEIKENDR